MDKSPKSGRHHHLDMRQYEGMDFRIILREARQTYNFTQTDFAESLGISVKHLNRIENCHQYPSFPLLYEMCSKLGYVFEVKFKISES